MLDLALWLAAFVTTLLGAATGVYAISTRKRGRIKEADRLLAAAYLLVIAAVLINLMR